MIPELRKSYNDAFTQERYTQMLTWIEEKYNFKPSFNIAESPLFIDKKLGAHVVRACRDVLQVVTSPDFAERSKAAIPAGQYVPNQNSHPLFLQLDFGLCRNAAGEVIPQLIEAQGFPSLYFFQFLLNDAYRKFFEIPEEFNARFGVDDNTDYLDVLRKSILGSHAPENVVLLEVDPVGQTTRIDFIIAQAELGITELCISDVEIDNGKLFYDRNGKRTRIHRIFNRVIFDELHDRPDLLRRFNLVEHVDVEWAGHPNWFFLLSKYTLPFIDSPYVPDTRFLSDVSTLPEDLSNYVLKPLYSFAGAGVDLHPTREKLETIENPHHYILQRKVKYADLIDTPDIPAQAELRMMFVWPAEADSPRLLTNLVRLSKGEMIGIKYNENFDWVGGSLGYFVPSSYLNDL